MARIANQFVTIASTILANKHPANMLLMRGFSQIPHLPGMQEIYRLKSAAIATYPMYRGLARLVGMDILPTGSTFEEQVATLKKYYAAYDFFY
jgi:2,3-bisphosphoglycerate-independent phosphoglycerate mutase